MHGSGFVFEVARSLQAGGALSMRPRVFICMLTTKHLFTYFICNFVCVSLLLAVLYLSSPGFL